MDSTLNFVKINSQIVNRNEIRKIDLSNLYTETIVVTLIDNSIHEVSGFAALEIIYLLSPSTLEGNESIKFKKHSWAVHNLIAHPIMQIIAFFKCYKRAIWIHDVTIPKPIRFK